MRRGPCRIAPRRMRQSRALSRLEASPWPSLVGALADWRADRPKHTAPRALLSTGINRRSAARNGGSAPKVASDETSKYRYPGGSSFRNLAAGLTLGVLMNFFQNTII